MSSYKILNNQKFESGSYSIVPIRMEDRYSIMQWRNEQIYHLRQNQPLTKEDQDQYFNRVISQLFELNKPNQILFSYLKNDKCIGYGGLVHINWVDKNAEISFVMDTSLENDYFEFHWTTYLALIEQVAFEELKFNKIFTYAFDLRPRLYSALLKSGFVKEATLKEHAFYNDRFIDVLIHSKFRDCKGLGYSLATEKDADILFKWVNDKDVRENSFNSKEIPWEEHKKWFIKKLKDKTCKIFIFYQKSIPIGQLRIDKVNSGWLIDYSIDRKFRGMGYGTKMLNLVKDTIKETPLIAQVKRNNVASAKTFEKCGFKIIDEFQENNDGIIQYKYEKL